MFLSRGDWRCGPSRLRWGRLINGCRVKRPGPTGVIGRRGSARSRSNTRTLRQRIAAGQGSASRRLARPCLPRSSELTSRFIRSRPRVSVCRYVVLKVKTTWSCSHRTVPGRICRELWRGPTGCGCRLAYACRATSCRCPPSGLASPPTRCATGCCSSLHSSVASMVGGLLVEGAADARCVPTICAVSLTRAARSADGIVGPRARSSAPLRVAAKRTTRCALSRANRARVPSRLSGGCAGIKKQNGRLSPTDLLLLRSRVAVRSIAGRSRRQALRISPQRLSRDSGWGCEPQTRLWRGRTGGSLCVSASCISGVYGLAARGQCHQAKNAQKQRQRLASAGLCRGYTLERQPFSKNRRSPLDGETRFPKHPTCLGKPGDPQHKLLSHHTLPNTSRFATHAAQYRADPKNRLADEFPPARRAQGIRGFATAIQNRHCTSPKNSNHGGVSSSVGHTA